MMKNLWYRERDLNPHGSDPSGFLTALPESSQEVRRVCQFRHPGLQLIVALSRNLTMGL
jgi:hypothetical protein